MMKLKVYIGGGSLNTDLFTKVLLEFVKTKFLLDCVIDS